MRRPAAGTAISPGQRALLGGLMGLAALAGVNALIARRTERRHPPDGAFLQVDGVRLHYSDQGQGSPIVLIHGNMVTGTDWNISGVSALLRRTHRVIIFDRPGFGHSDRPRGQAWTLAQQAELIHRATRQLGVDRPVVVGHSLGAMVALALADAYSADLAALVVLSGPYFEALRLDALLAATGAWPVWGDALRYTIAPLLGWLAMPALTHVSFWPRRVPARFRAAYSEAMALRPSQLRATWMDAAAMAPGAVQLQSHYARLDVPVVIISGAGDQVVSRRMSERLHASLPRSVLHIVSGAGHMVHHTAPDVVAEAAAKAASPNIGADARTPVA